MHEMIKKIRVDTRGSAPVAQACLHLSCALRLHLTQVHHAPVCLHLTSQVQAIGQISTPTPFGAFSSQQLWISCWPIDLLRGQTI